MSEAAEQLIVDPEPIKFDKEKVQYTIPESQIIENVEKNIRRQLPQMMPHASNPKHIAICAGGPSLETELGNLRDLYFNGSPVVALNGSGRFLLEHGIKPAMHIVMDGQPENVGFFENYDPPGCKYFLASQCNPMLFEAVSGRDVTIFHIRTTDAEEEILGDYYDGNFAVVEGGSTVGLRAIPLLRTLGFHFMHLFGYDSCYGPEFTHHAYSQKWHDRVRVYRFMCAGRLFYCAGWQAAQAQHFCKLIAEAGDHFNLKVYGDGLIAHMIRTSGTLVQQEED